MDIPVSNGKMKPEIKRRWLKALRSGDYKQGIQFLKRDNRKGEPTFCCLGVLCELYSKENPDYIFEPDETSKIEGLYTFMGERGVLPKPVMEWAGLSIPSGSFVAFHKEGGPEYLTDLNDNGRNFDHLADVIEEDL